MGARERVKDPRGRTIKTPEAGTNVRQSCYKTQPNGVR